MGIITIQPQEAIKDRSEGFLAQVGSTMLLLSLDFVLRPQRSPTYKLLLPEGFLSFSYTPEMTKVHHPVWSVFCLFSDLYSLSGHICLGNSFEVMSKITIILCQEWTFKVTLTFDVNYGLCSFCFKNLYPRVWAPRHFSEAQPYSLSGHHLKRT